MHRACVICGFPGVGKSHLLASFKYLKILDIDSDRYSHIWKDGKKINVRNPDFPNNYIKKITDNLDCYDLILVSTHNDVRHALQSNNINYYIVYPNISLKDTYIQRYIDRKSDTHFVEFMRKSWDTFIGNIERDTYGSHIKLDSKDDYLEDVFKRRFCTFYRQLCSVKYTNADEYEGNACTSGKCISGIVLFPHLINKVSQKNKKVYIAGKITGYPEYKKRFLDAENYLKDTGYTPLSPAILPEGFTQEEYLHMCFSMIDVCDSIFFLDNWMDSPGAKEEFNYAVKKKKNFMFQ